MMERQDTYADANNMLLIRDNCSWGQVGLKMQKRSSDQTKVDRLVDPKHTTSLKASKNELYFKRLIFIL